jgi:hypothetical protein
MASRSKQNVGLVDSDSETIAADNDSPAYSWSFEQAPSPSPAYANSVQNPASSGGPQTDVGSASMPSSSAPALAAVGTPGADVFPLNTATLNAAVAPAPQLAQITGYSASHGDVIDFSAILHGSYAPLTPDTTQLRVTASSTSATLDFNIGTAEHPHWTALATLDGVHAGDTVNVALDATHTVHLQVAWLT